MMPFLKSLKAVTKFLLTSLVLAWLLTIILVFAYNFISGPHPECATNPEVGACNYWDRTIPEAIHLSPLPVLPVFLIVLLARLITRAVSLCCQTRPK